MTRWLAGLVVLAVVGLPATTARAAERLSLAEAKSAAFPDRAYVLTLPNAQRLREAEIDVTENGAPVDGLTISGDGGASAVVLAIDASESMHGAALTEAMRAARTFAERRRPGQRLGILFFSRDQSIALQPTKDQAAIDQALLKPPILTKGTRVYDAAATAIAMLKRAEVAAGSVVVLSDGADVGSQIGRNDLIVQARKARVRLFGVGLRSPSFNSVSLRALSASGGTYTETSSAEGLSAVYSRLGERLGHEFLITYRSRQPLESKVAVAVAVSGIADVATSAYATPGFPVPPGAAKPAPSWWEGTSAVRVVTLAVMLLLGLGLFLLIQPMRQSVSRRIANFTSRTTAAEDEIEEAHRARALFAAADGRLSSSRRWLEFALDVELSKIAWSPRRIVAVTMLLTLVLTVLMVLAKSYVFAGLALVGVPFVTRAVIRYLATRVRRRFEDQLPDNLQVLASALRAGHSFIGALGVMVKDAPEPSRKEFRRVVRDEQLGVPVEQSLEIVHDRMKCEDVIYVGLIATLQRETGGNTAEVLDKVVETMRERGKIRRLVRTLTAQGRLGGWIVTVLPIAMIVFLNLFQPHYMDPMLSRTIGWFILILAGCMVLLGSYCIRRIVDIKV